MASPTIEVPGGTSASGLAKAVLGAAGVVVTVQDTAEKGAANGYAGLDASGLLAAAQIPSLAATYQALSGRGVANGYASLDGSGKVPSAQLPAAGVSSFNALTGAVTISAGPNVTLTPSGNDIAIAASGGGGSLTPLFDSTLAAAATTIDTGAGGIAAGHAAILVELKLRQDNAVVFGAGVLLRFNNDSGSNYDESHQQSTGTASSPNTAVGQTSYLGIVPLGASADADAFATATLIVPAYDDAHHKTFNGTNAAIGSSAAANALNRTLAGRYKSTTAISRVAITASAGANFVADSRMTIWPLG